MIVLSAKVAILYVYAASRFRANVRRQGLWFCVVDYGAHIMHIMHIMHASAIVILDGCCKMRAPR